MSTLDRYTPPPTVAEYEALNQMAAGLARTTVVPNAYKGKPGEIVAAALYGREIGLSPLASLQRIIVINGKPTLDAQGMSAVVRSAGHSILGDSDPEKATVTGKRADNGDTMKVVWTIGMAKNAGLVKKGPWTDYPAAMLWARAVTQLCRQLFPDVLAGFSYAPEEIGGPPPAVELDSPAASVGVVKPDLEVEVVEVQQTGPVGEPVAQANGTVPPVGRTAGLDWDDVAREYAEAAALQTDDPQVVSEMRKRKALMPGLHQRLGNLTDDAGKERLLTGHFQAGSWKQLHSDVVKLLLSQTDEHIVGLVQS